MSNGANDKGTDSPALPIKGHDSREAMYNQIARVHRQLVEVKWRARTAGKPMAVHPNVLIHCEEAITFLAGEVLALRAMLEKNEEAKV